VVLCEMGGWGLRMLIRFARLAILSPLFHTSGLPMMHVGHNSWAHVIVWCLSGLSIPAGHSLGCNVACYLKNTCWSGGPNLSQSGCLKAVFLPEWYQL
jgi:hypothetical protein